MDVLPEVLSLMKKKAAIEKLIAEGDVVGISDERELLDIRAKLERFPVTARAILDTAYSTHRNIDALSCADVERHVG
jgi:hypothetical protein